MIVTVTLNPAVDKTVKLEELKRGGLNRIEHVEMDAGGKGINVSKTINMLGGSSIATGFLGGNASAYITNALSDYHITMDFIQVSGETRTNLKIVEPDGLLTEFNEAGPIISQEQIKKLMEKLDELAGEDTWFVFSGSAPKGVPTDIYQQMISRVKQKGSKTVLDADGELLRNGMKACPDIIKPNRYELEQYFGESAADDEILIGMGKKLLQMGIQMVVISLGKNGAIFMNESVTYGVPAVDAHVNSTVGAGDSLVAGLVYGICEKMPLEECIRLSVATSAGTVMTEGTKPPTVEMIRNLEERVNLFVISRGV